jgi:hypothetical protein
MTRTRLGLLGLCAMVFGLMAFGATGAHAEKGSVWLILNAKKELKTGAELHASVSLTTDVNGVLHSEILKIKVLFLCTTIEALNAKLQEEGIIGNEVVTNSEGLKEGRGSQIKFSGCTTDLNGSPASECTPEDKTALGGPGTIVTKLGHALAKLHELVADKVKDDIFEILPDTGLGGEFALISLPKACPIGTSVPVFGRLFLRDCENLALVHLEKHLVESDATTTKLTRLYVISDTAEHAATLLGSAWALLTGEHKDFLWSISNL